MLEHFSYAEYRNLLDALRRERACLSFGDFRDNDPPPRYLILRHDVDFCLEHAMEMARLEAEMGVRATYFLLPSTPHYNLLAPPNVTRPAELASLGHEVGLHYDLAVIESLGGDAFDRLRGQADLLGRLSGQPVRSIAMHNPSLSGEDPFARQDEFVNAYAPAFTREIAYYSDSCGAWRDSAFAALTGEPTELPPRIQLLIHPILWGAEPGDRWRRLAAWHERRQQELRGWVAEVEEIWRNHSGVAEHDRRNDGRS